MHKIKGSMNIEVKTELLNVDVQPRISLHRALWTFLLLRKLIP